MHTHIQKFKQIYIIATLLCLSVFASAQSGSLQVIIKSNYSNLTLEIKDQFTLQETFNKDIVLANLNDGTYSVNIYYNTGRNGVSYLMRNQRVRIERGARVVIEESRNKNLDIRIVRNTHNPSYPNTSQRPQPETNNKYPSHNNSDRYRPMGDSEFNTFLRSVKNESYRKDKERMIEAASSSMTLTTEQIREVVRLFSYDSEKFTCAEMLIKTAYDPSTLYLIANEFSSSSTKEKYYNLIKANNSNSNRPINNSGRPRSMEQSDFTTFIQNVRKESFDKNKIQMIEAASSTMVLTTEQIREVVRLFSFDSNKFQCAEILVKTAYDPSTLYLIANEFSTSSTKEKYYNLLKR